MTSYRAILLLYILSISNIFIISLLFIYFLFIYIFIEIFYCQSFNILAVTWFRNFGRLLFQLNFNILLSLRFPSPFKPVYFQVLFFIYQTIITLHSPCVWSNPCPILSCVFPSFSFQSCHSVSLLCVLHQDCWASSFPVCSVVSTV